MQTILVDGARRRPHSVRSPVAARADARLIAMCDTFARWHAAAVQAADDDEKLRRAMARRGAVTDRIASVTSASLADVILKTRIAVALLEENCAAEAGASDTGFALRVLRELLALEGAA